MKAIKKRIWLVAIALIVTTLGACTSDRLDVDEPVMKKVYTFTTTLSQPDYATTRVLLTEGGTGGEAKIKIAWQVGDTLNVTYDKPDDGTGSGSAIIKNVDSDGVATVRVSIGDDPKDGGNITFKYPRTNNDVGEFLQKGTLEDIQKNYATLYGTGKMIVADGSVTLDGDVEINKGTAIWKFTFTDGTNDITSDITKLTLTFSDEDYGDPITYEVNPTSSLDEIYVAFNNDFAFYMSEVTITATTSKGEYSKSYEKAILNAGKFYVSEGVELTDYFNGIKVGDYIYADGSWGSTPASNVIAIVFSKEPTEKDIAAGYTHGYAISVKNVSSSTYYLDTQDSEINLIEPNGWKYNRDGRTATEEYLALGSGRGPAANAAHDFGEKPASMYSDWFLPAIGQWYDICVNLATLPSAADNNIYYYQYSGKSGQAASALNKRLTDSGASSVTSFTNSPTTCYMTSSRETKSIVIHCTFSNSGILHLEHNGNNPGYVRPAIAF